MNSYLTISVLSLLCFACGTKNLELTSSENSSSTLTAEETTTKCIVDNLIDKENPIAHVKCSDGRVFDIPIGFPQDGLAGRDGSNGADGVNGIDGSSCSVKSSGPTSATIECTDGSISYLDLKLPLATKLKGLALWLDASDTASIHKSINCDSAAAEGDEVLCWQDKSAGVKVKARSNRGPKYQAGFNALDFRSASLEAMEAKLSERLRGDDYTIFIVASIDVAASDTDARFLTLLGKGVTNDLGSSTSSVPLRKKSNENLMISTQKNANSKTYSMGNGVRRLFAITLSSGNRLDYRDSSGQKKSSKVNSVNLDVDRVRLMMGANRFAQGTVSELLIYDRKLPENDFLKIYTELLVKWGL